MIRALLAVALAAALLAATLPAVESAAADRTAAALDRDIDRIERAGKSLLADDDPGARRVVTVTLPAKSLSSAGVDGFTIACQPRCTVRYRLDGAGSRTRRLTLPVTTPDGPIRLARAGEHRLTLRLARSDGSRVVELHS
ncbi:DUF7311 family protein [Halolamina salifodinae]|uniref:DUF7311 domain-containing protein n=1 Tax=Halolamina salifodinae TaxID=1202767 RepID=A0A8T4GQZ8_9EURY|nr:hypothetical protein [Halolamina salifodinae]MBP1985581.1 hypothetical protein [Halolamina salifodinae]